MLTDDVDISELQPLTAEVIEYFVDDDNPNVYNNHIFIIRVWVGEFIYSVNRSYAAFCELDHLIRRQYPRSKIPTLDLVGLPLFAKQAQSKLSAKAAVDTTRESESAATMQRKSMFGFRKKDAVDQLLTAKKDTSEIIAQKKPVVSKYLQEMLKIPEILISSPLLYFLDEESTDGEKVEEFVEDSLDQHPELDLMMTGDKRVNQKVTKELRITLDVEPQTVVLWHFNTKLRDIGFSVLFNDVEVVTYQRYNSHERTVKGSFEVPVAVATPGEEGEATAIWGNSQVTLLWDNSYSKYRSKQLTYLANTVPAEDFRLAQELGQEKNRILIKEKQRLSSQRVLLRRMLSRASQSALSSNSSTKEQTYYRSTGSFYGNLPDGSSRMSQIASGADLAGMRGDGGSFDTNPFGRNSEGGEGEGTGTHTPLNGEEGEEGAVGAGDSGGVSGGGSKPARQGQTMIVPSSASGWSKSKLMQKHTHAELAGMVLALLSEKHTLQSALGLSEGALVTERDAAARAMELMEEARLQRDSLEDELKRALIDLDVLRLETQQQMEADQKQVELAMARQCTDENVLADVPNRELELDEATQLPGEVLVRLPAWQQGPAYDLLREHCQTLSNKLTASEQLRSDLEASTAKHKAEKKQLKSYALQMKQGEEALKSAAQQSEHERTIAAYEAQVLKTKLDAQHLECEKLEAHVTQLEEEVIKWKTAAVLGGEEKEGDKIETTANKQVTLFSQGGGGNGKGVAGKADDDNNNNNSNNNGLDLDFDFSAISNLLNKTKPENKDIMEHILDTLLPGTAKGVLTADLLLADETTTAADDNSVRVVNPASPAAVAGKSLPTFAGDNEEEEDDDQAMKAYKLKQREVIKEKQRQQLLLQQEQQLKAEQTELLERQGRFAPPPGGGDRTDYNISIANSSGSSNASQKPIKKQEPKDDVDLIVEDMKIVGSLLSSAADSVLESVNTMIGETQEQSQSPKSKLGGGQASPLPNSSSSSTKTTTPASGSKKTSSSIAGIFDSVANSLFGGDEQQTNDDAVTKDNNNSGTTRDLLEEQRRQQAARVQLLQEQRQRIQMQQGDNLLEQDQLYREQQQLQQQVKSKKSSSGNRKGSMFDFGF